MISLSRRALFISTALVTIVSGFAGVAINDAVTSRSATASTSCVDDAEACLAEIQAVLNKHVTTTTTEVPSSTTNTAATSTTSSPSSSTTSTQLSTTTTVQPSTSAPTSTLPATTSTTSSPTSTTTLPTTTTTVRPSGQPDASNTGVPAGTVLTNYSGCTIPAGAAVDAKTFNCSSLSIGTNVTITRSRINGNAFSVIQNPGSGLKISDSELSCGRSAGSYGINGGNSATFTRLNVRLCENAIEPGNDVVFQDSWVHDMWAQSAGHNDGVSIDGSHSNVKILRNNIDMTGCSGCGTPTSSVMVDNWPSGSLTGIVIDGNWLKGGQFVQYFDSSFSSGTITATLTNNKFSGGVFGFCNRSTSKVTLTQSGNTPTPAPC